MDSIIIKFDQDVSTIESSSLISISDRDQKLMKMKYQTNILGNKFVELSREKIIENQLITNMNIYMTTFKKHMIC